MHRIVDMVKLLAYLPKIISIGIALAILLMNPKIAYSQSVEDTDMNLFPKGYSASPFDNSRSSGKSGFGLGNSMGNRQPQKPKEFNTNRWNQQKNPGSNSGKSPKATPLTSWPKQSSSSSMGLEQEGLGVFDVGMVLSGDDYGHFLKSLTDLNNLAKDRGIPFGRIQIVGNPQKTLKNFDRLSTGSFDMKDLREWDGMGVPSSGPIDFGSFYALVEKLKFAGYPSSEYGKLTRSPTWIVRTEKGIFVLEGLSRGIEELFNEQGEFLETALNSKGAA